MDLSNMANREKKSMNFIRRLNRRNFYLSSQRFEIYRFFKVMEVVNKCKISAQYLQNFAS